MARRDVFIGGAGYRQAFAVLIIRRPAARRAELCAVADGGGVADAEQVGELERSPPLAWAWPRSRSARVLRGDAYPAHGLLDVAAVDGTGAAAGAAVTSSARTAGFDRPRPAAHKKDGGPSGVHRVSAHGTHNAYSARYRRSSDP